MRRSRGRNRRNRYAEKEEINPMNFVSNLSDVMLILAVGIMLALILHWNVKIQTTEESNKDANTQDAISFNEDDLENMEELPDDMERMGDVYYDPASGKYYIIENSGTAD